MRAIFQKLSESQAADTLATAWYRTAFKVHIPELKALVEHHGFIMPDPAGSADRTIQTIDRLSKSYSADSYWQSLGRIFRNLERDLSFDSERLEGQKRELFQETQGIRTTRLEEEEFQARFALSMSSDRQNELLESIERAHEQELHNGTLVIGIQTKISALSELKAKLAQIREKSGLDSGVPGRVHRRWENDMNKWLESREKPDSESHNDTQDPPDASNSP